MNYLALVLSGAMQSWGAPSSSSPNSGSPRNTAGEPTLAGLYGLINSALGVPRSTVPPFPLKDFRFIIRTDNAGVLSRDYQIAQRKHHGFANAGADSTKEIPKMYLEDAVFTVLVGHEDSAVLDRVAEAFQNPQFSLFLGRRAHVLSLPVLLGKLTLEEGSSLEAPVELLHDSEIFWGAGSRDLVRDVHILDSATQVRVPRFNSRVVSLPGHPDSYDVRDREYSEYDMIRYDTTVSRGAITKRTSLEEWGRLQGILCSESLLR